MSKHRLSKLQKWILTECYKVTVLLDYDSLVPIKGKRGCFGCIERSYGAVDAPDDGFDGKSELRVTSDRWDCIASMCPHNGNYSCDVYTFYREDVLLSYFQLEISKRSADSRVLHFAQSADYSKAHATLSRSLKALKETDYIGLYGSTESSQIIRLSDKGARKAAELLMVEYASPPVETEEDVKQRDLAHRLELAKINAAIFGSR